MVGKSALLRSSWSCNQSQSFAETASLMKASTSSCSCCSSSSCCKSLHPDKHQLLPCLSLCSCMSKHFVCIILLDGAPSMSYDIAPSYAVQDKVSHCSQAYLARRCIFCNYIFNGTLLLVQKVATKAACLSSIRIGPTCPTSTTICSEKEKSK